MSRYIDADKMDELKHTTGLGFLDTSDLEECLSCFPTEDVEKVKHGHWIVEEDEYEICATEFTCSKCGETFCSSEVTDKEMLEMMKYCMNCGAKMDEKLREEENKDEKIYRC